MTISCDNCLNRISADELVDNAGPCLIGYCEKCFRYTILRLVGASDTAQPSSPRPLGVDWRGGSKTVVALFPSG